MTKTGQFVYEGWCRSMLAPSAPCGFKRLSWEELSEAFRTDAAEWNKIGECVTDALIKQMEEERGPISATKEDPKDESFHAFTCPKCGSHEFGTALVPGGDWGGSVVSTATDRHPRLRPGIIFAVVLGILAAGLLLARTALAQLPDGSEPANLVPRLLAAVFARNWLVVLGLAGCTIIATAVTHWTGLTKVLPGATSDRGATIWTFIVAAIGAACTSLSIGQPLSLATAQTALGVGFVAVGGYSALRKITGDTWLGKIIAAMGPKQ